MLTRAIFLLSLTLTGLFIYAIARPDPSAPTAEVPDVAFVPQLAALDAKLDIHKILRDVCTELSAQKAPWLAVKFRQAMRDGSRSFVTQGSFQRGPAGCARLELEIIDGPPLAKLTVVSDGELLAQARRIGLGEPSVTIAKIPTSDRHRQDGFLINAGCGGPGAVLEQMNQHLQGATLQSGHLGDRAVTLVEGEFDRAPANLPPTIRARVRAGRIYLDAQTRWPCRLEWWAAKPSAERRPLLSVDYLDLELGRQLSDEDCKKTFSYHPDSPAKK
ncbi:MAG: hypothetical protein HYX68_10960 [Planctomycetes bacterium]|nr:hypothetical protein [Planctomycetota bacterium]